MADVFVSYAWGGESENVVNELEASFAKRGMHIIRDKRDLGFKGLIKEFMKRLGHADFVIVVISDKYLKSENCMFELVEILNNENFVERIFPVVLEDALIYKPIGRLGYVKFWEDKIAELDEMMKSVGAANLQGIREDIDLYTEIRKTIATITDKLRNINVLHIDTHRQGDYSILFDAIDKQLNPVDGSKEPEAPIEPDKWNPPKSKFGKLINKLLDNND